MPKWKAFNPTEVGGKADSLLCGLFLGFKVCVFGLCGTLTISWAERLVRSQVLLINSWTHLIWLRTEPSSPILAFWESRGL